MLFVSFKIREYIFNNFADAPCIVEAQMNGSTRLELTGPSQHDFQHFGFQNGASRRFFLAVALGLTACFIRRPLFDAFLNLSGPKIALSVWVILSLPFLLLGLYQPFSSVDLFSILPTLQYLGEHVDNRFLHPLAGGIDRHSGFVYETGLVSIPRYLAEFQARTT